MHLKAEDILLSDLKQLPELKLDTGYVVRLECDEPTPEVQEIARKELRENPDIVRESLQALKDLIKEDKELDAPVHSEAWLYRFLRPTKFYPESAYKLVKNYYQFKEKHKNVYDNLKPSNEKNVFSHDLLTVLPKRDQGGRRILILHLGKKWKHNKVSLDEIYKGAVLFLEAAMLEPESQICGAQVIFDMDGMSLQQTWQFTPPFAKRIVDLLQDCIALRIKGLHIVNQPYIFNMVFALFKPFLRDKLRSRIIFHGTDRKSLHEYLSAKCLPECYGGTLEIPRVTGLQWFEPLCMLDKEYEAIATYGYKKKPKK